MYKLMMVGINMETYAELEIDKQIVINTIKYF